MSPKATPDRHKNFKNKGRNVESLRKLRAEVSVEIRKAKRDNHLCKRRHLEGDEESLSPTRHSQQAPSTRFGIDDIVAGIYSGDLKMEFTATRAARKILSQKNDPQIDLLINAGIVPRLAEFLGHDNNPHLQDEAARALGTIAAGTSEQTKTVAQTAGAVDGLIALLRSPHPNVAAEAVWVLGNIAGDGPELRDLVTELGTIEPLVDLIKLDTPTGLLRDVTWAISNLCRRHRSQRPSVAAVRKLLPALAQLVHYSPDKEVLIDACWAFSYLTDGPEERVQHVIDAGVVPPLVALLDHPEDEVVTAALCTVGNIVKQSVDAQTDFVLAAGACPHFANLLEHKKKSIAKEAAWTVSNVAAGNASHVQALFSNNVIYPLINVLDKGDFKSQKEAAWAVANITRHGNIEQIATLCQMGVIGPLCNLLDSNGDASTILAASKALENMLAAAEKVGELEKLTLHIEECRGLDRIENLQYHENDKIYDKALGILEHYFITTENEEDSQLVPSTSADGGNYVFN